MKYLIVGGVAGGATAAARIRRNTEKDEIILFEKGDHISYANCGLPYYVGGVIADRDRLFVQTPEAFGRRFRIDVRVRQEVTRVDPATRTVTVRRADGSTYTETYDKLLLSPGSSPVRPPLPGVESEGIFTLRNVEDTDRIKAYTERPDVRRAVVVGGGFIGLEMAENLRHAGLDVSVVEMADQVMGPIDYSMAAFVHDELTRHGVKLYLGEAVSRFDRDASGLTVTLQSGTQLRTDMVLLSIGVRPQTQLATDAGLTIGEARGIWVNEFLQTSDEHIYAVGDAIEFPHPLTGRPWLNFLAGPANRQARIVADNMVLGQPAALRGRNRHLRGQSVRSHGGLHRIARQAAETDGHPLPFGHHPPHLTRRLLSRRPADGHQGHFRARLGQALRRSNRRPRRCGQAHRRIRPRSQKWRNSARPDPRRASLRATLLLGQGPGGHGPVT